ncbi:MAG: hypothetical protein ABI760_01725 [Ferruginibacter sp.]
MIWLIAIILFIVLLLYWLMISPLVLEIDSRIPGANLSWGSIGKAVILYDDEWWVKIQILLFKMKIRLSDIKATQKIITQKKTKIRKGKKWRLIKKMAGIIRTFQVVEWQLAFDSGDYALNSQLYPLNFFPYCYSHLDINFKDENYLYLRIINIPWKLVVALFR